MCVEINSILLRKWESNPTHDQFLHLRSRTPCPDTTGNTNGLPGSDLVFEEMTSPVRQEQPPAKRPRSQDKDGAGNGQEVEEDTALSEREVPETTQEENDEDYEEEFRRLEAVSAVQDELNALEEEEAQQVLLVHKAFLKRKRPLYIRRQEAISKVPDFWLKVLLAHPATQPWVSDVDQLALSYLESVGVHKALSKGSATGKQQEAQQATGEDVEGGSQNGDKERRSDTASTEELDDDDDVGFRVTFTFRENPFFVNFQLWKEWEPAESHQAEFSPVEWKDTEEAKEVQSCLVCNLDPASVELDTPSFFSIFCEDVDDYELGEALRGEVTENPLDIYMRHDFDAEGEEDEAGGEEDFEDGQAVGEGVEDVQEGFIEGDDQVVYEDDGEGAPAWGYVVDGGVVDGGWEGGEEEVDGGKEEVDGGEDSGFQDREAVITGGKGKRKRDLVAGRHERGQGEESSLHAESDV